jgi:hypothetical protein
MTVTAPLTPQNFSIPAGYNEVITFDVDPAVTPSLQGMVVWWRVYEQHFGIPDSVPIIEKALPDIISIDSPLSFTVQLYTADTISLLRNYYHEATIADAMGEVIGGSFGIMTVTATENRP